MLNIVHQHVWLSETDEFERYRPALSQGKGGLLSNKWKEETYKMLLANFDQHERLLLVRVDLNYPTNEEFISPGNSDIRKFFKEVNRVLETKAGREKYDYAKLVGHVCVREYGKIKVRKHYHALLLFKDISHLGFYQSKEGVQWLVRETWENITGGRAHFVKPIVIENTDMYDNDFREWLDVTYVDYVCKISGKRADHHRNLLISRHDNHVPFSIENKVCVVKEADGQECRDRLNKGFMKYKKSLLVKARFRQLNNYEADIPVSLISNNYIHLLHNTLMDDKKGGITFGCMSKNGNYWELAFIMSGGRYRSAKTPMLMVEIRETFNDLMEEHIGETMMMGLYSFSVRHEDIIIEDENDSRKAYKKALNTLLSNETVIPVCFYDDGERNETCCFIEKPSRLSLEERKAYGYKDTLLDEINNCDYGIDWLDDKDTEDRETYTDGDFNNESEENISHDMDD